MSVATEVAPGRGSLTITVSDPTGQETVSLANLSPSVTVSQVLAMATSELKVPTNIVWDLRDEATSRLLPANLPLNEVAGEKAPHLRASLQPDAGLA
jgi:hypothetical protein